MASNKKWIKRALRRLSEGEEYLWGLVKQRISPEQARFFETEYFDRTGDNTEPTDNNVTAQQSVEEVVEEVVEPKPRAKKKSVRTSATKKNTKATKTSKTKRRRTTKTKEN